MSVIDRSIQAEIDERTERLRSALPALEKESLLYQMLAGALQPPGAARHDGEDGGPSRHEQDRRPGLRSVCQRGGGLRVHTDLRLGPPGALRR